MLSFPYLWDEGSLPESEPIEIVTWADGTDEQIVAMVEAADRGEIELTDYWAVDDTRSVNIASFSGNTTATHVAQTVEVVLMHEGLYQTTDNKTVNFVIGFKDFLANGTNREGEKMNSSDTNSGSWRDSLMRTLCNGNLYNALPTWLRNIIKTVKVTTGVYTGNNTGGTNIVTEDKIFLAAEKEVQGSKTYSTDNEAGVLTQLTYYTTAANRIKKAGASGSASQWWVRSPRYYHADSFCNVGNNGGASGNAASHGFGLAPCMCI